MNPETIISTVKASNAALLAAIPALVDYAVAAGKIATAMNINVELMAGQEVESGYRTLADHYEAEAVNAFNHIDMIKVSSRAVHELLAQLENHPALKNS